MKTILVYDFETTDVDPYTCQPIQLAALPIDGNRLVYDKDNAFVSMIKPTDFDSISEENLAFHAKSRGCSKQDILDMLHEAPEVTTVWDNFLKYLRTFNVRNKLFEAPISAGHNIVSYDSIIAERLRQKYSPDQKFLWHPRDYIDTVNLCFLWFESLSQPKKYNFKDLRDFFGYSDESKQNAHEALSDCVDCAELVIKFLKLHRGLAPKVNFKNSMRIKNDVCT